MTVEKLRAESKIGEYNVCIDEVVRLGLFIELEVIKGEMWTVPYDTSIRNL
ncbi:MAG: hypothetical protein Q4F02_00155 [Candidatus Saccharibacteria bacterium]|nr:hypothetical protein [Candidatus Saccharibacteria bacterium]